jgi:hypothetical protein
VACGETPDASAVTLTLVLDALGRRFAKALC